MSEQSGKTVQVERGPKRVRAYFNGELVADTYAPLLVWEIPNYPTYYIPIADIAAELIPSGDTEHKPGLGDAEILHVKTGGGTADNAARRYPSSPAELIRDAVRLDWASMSEWLEE